MEINNSQAGWPDRYRPRDLESMALAPEVRERFAGYLSLFTNLDSILLKCLTEQSLKGSLYGDLVGVAQVFEGEPEAPIEANIHRDSSITGLELWSGKLRSPGLGSPIDGEVTFDLTISSDRLKNDRDGVARDILRTLLFALNWGPTDDSSIMNVMNIGYEYNSWQLRSY